MLIGRESSKDDRLLRTAEKAGHCNLYLRSRQSSRQCALQKSMPLFGAHLRDSHDVLDFRFVLSLHCLIIACRDD